MALIDVPAGEGVERLRLWAMAPAIQGGVNAFRDAVYGGDGQLSIREKEVARMRIAQINACDIWLDTRAASAMQQGLTDDLYAGVDRYQENAEFTMREKLAIEYAERFALDHERIGAELVDRMRAEYSDPEIVELSGLVAFCLGVGRVYAVLDIANECPVIH